MEIISWICKEENIRISQSFPIWKYLVMHASQKWEPETHGDAQQAIQWMCTLRRALIMSSTPSSRDQGKSNKNTLSLWRILVKLKVYSLHKHLIYSHFQYTQLQRNQHRICLILQREEERKGQMEYM